MSEANKVPRRINISPPFAFGVDGPQALILVASLMILGLLVTKLTSGALQIVIGWISVMAIIGVEYLLLRLSNEMTRGLFGHLVRYAFIEGRRPKRFCGKMKNAL